MASTSTVKEEVSEYEIIEKLNDEVQCPICLERLNSPRILSCLHSFCEDCLQHMPAFYDFDSDDDDDDDGNYDEDEKPFIKCAVCRAKTMLPQGVAGLKSDFRANKVGELLDVFEKRKRKNAESEFRCDVCSPNGDVPCVPATEYCQDCGQLFCDQCNKVHGIIKDTKSHHLVRISELLTGKAKLRKIHHQDDASVYKTCTDHHGEGLHFFCKKCVKPVCKICVTFGTCKSHEWGVSPLDDATSEMSGVVGLLTDRLSHRQKEIEQVLSSANGAISKTENAKHTKLRQMQRVHGELIHKLNVRYQQEMRNTQAVFDSKIQDLRTVIQNAETMKKVSEKTVVLTDELLRGERVSGLDLASQLACLQSVLNSVPPAQIESLKGRVSMITQHTSSRPENELVGDTTLHWVHTILRPSLAGNRVNQPQHEMVPMNRPIPPLWNPNNLPLITMSTPRPPNNVLPPPNNVFPPPSTVLTPPSNVFRPSNAPFRAGVSRTDF